MTVYSYYNMTKTMLIFSCHLNWCSLASHGLIKIVLVEKILVDLIYSIRIIV